MPRLVAFPAGRSIRNPLFDAEGNVVVEGVDFVITSGVLRDIPAFRAEPETKLQAALDRIALAPVFVSDDARVYKLRDKPY